VAEWKTKVVVMEGGTQTSLEFIAQESQLPGSLIDSLNVESGKSGGYSRIKGFAKFDSNEVPGSGNILGTFVFNGGAIACRGTAVYFSLGSGWGSAINPSTRTSAGYYQGEKYTWGATERITLVDGVNKPFKYDGSTATDLTAAPAGATCVTEFKNHLFLGVGGTLYFSAPNNDTDYTTGSGGGADVIGDEITALASWRGNLYIFCRGSIHRLSGNSASDFVSEPITEFLGCEHGNTVKELAGDLFFLSDAGVRTMSNTETVGDVSLELVTDMLRADVQSLHDTFEGGIIHAAINSTKGQYRLFGYKDSVGTSNPLDAITICATTNMQGQPTLECFKIKGIYATGADSDFKEGNELFLHGCGVSGYIYRQDFGDSFDGGNIEAFIQLPYMVFDDPAFRKNIHRLTVHANADSDALVQLSAQLYLNDNDQTIVQPTSIDLSGNVPGTAAIYGFAGGTSGGTLYGAFIYGRGVTPKYKAYPSGSGENISTKLFSNDTLPAWSVKTLIFEYELGDRI